MLKTDSFAIIKKVVKPEYLGTWRTVKDWLYSLVLKTQKVNCDTATLNVEDNMVISVDRTYPLNIAEGLCVLKLLNFLEKCHTLQITSKDLKRLTAKKAVRAAQLKSDENLPKQDLAYSKAELSLLKATIDQQKLHVQLEKQQILISLEDLCETALLVKTAEEAKAETVTFPSTETVH